MREEFFHRSRTFTLQNGELVAARQKRRGELQSPLLAARCGGAEPSRQRGYVGTDKAIRIKEQGVVIADVASLARVEEHTSELQSLMRNLNAVVCLNKKKNKRICKYLIYTSSTQQLINTILRHDNYLV